MSPLLEILDEHLRDLNQTLDVCIDHDVDFVQRDGAYFVYSQD